MNDELISRALAALRIVDGTTGATITAPLTVTAPGARFLRNRSGLYVITRADALPGHHEAFASPPAEPAVEDVALTVSIADRSGRYLSRSAVVRLPRDPDPDHAAQATSLFRPVDVPLFPSPLAPSDPGWARLRVSVRRTGGGAGVPRAFLRVHRAGDADAVLGRGLSDERGEAFVPVAGIPTVNWSSDPENPVLASSLSAVLVAYFDAGAGESPNVTAIEENRAALPSASVDVSLASGRDAFASVELTLP